MDKARILIVEDEAVVAENLEMVITDVGYEVVGRASSADDAVNSAIKLKPDLILMDIVLMGKKNGIDASYEIKEKLDIPVIFLTAYSDFELIDRAKNTEPYAYIVKPFQEQQLFASIEMALYKSQMGKQLKESETKFRDLTELLPQTVFETDERGNLTFANRAGFDYFGYAQEDFDGSLTALQMIAPEDRDRAKENIGKVMKGTDPGGTEYMAQKKDGSTFPIIIYSTSIIHEQKSVGVRGVIVDITVRKQAEEKLRESEEQYRILVEHAPLGIFKADTRGNIEVANPALLRMLGSPSEEATKQVNLLTFPLLMEAGVSELVKECMREKSQLNSEFLYRSKWGKEIYCNLHLTPRFDTVGKLNGVQGIMEDITERKSAEKQIKEEHRLAEFYIDLMGHDINNMNQATMGYLELLLSMPDFPDKFRKSAEIALNHVRKSTDIISNVRTLSEIQSGEIELARIDIYPDYASAVEVVKSLPEEVRINSNVTDGAYFIRGNTLLFNVFSNLLNNAVKFDYHEVVEIDVDISPSADNWRLEFKDRGHGISDEYKKIIFNRLEQAGEKAQGTGLGLTIVKYVVASYGGSIWVEDRVSRDRTQGSNFILLLPKAK